jgi:Membrane protein putatively involved in post-translational modification of the autoinducing quorum-sensing peptide
MRFINVLSYKFADSLTRELNHSHEKKRVYYYGFQIVIGGLFKAVLMVLLSLVLGIFQSTFTVLAFFAVLRLVAGGYHMDNYTKCMVTSFALFFLLGFLVKYTYNYWSLAMLIAISIIAFIAALITSIKYAPADTPYKPITKPEKIRKLKTMSILVVFMWSIIDIILIYNKLNYYILAGCLGMLMAAFIISPAGYEFFDFISGKRRKANKAKIST